MLKTFLSFFLFFIFTHVSCVCSTQLCRYLLCRPHSHRMLHLYKAIYTFQRCIFVRGAILGRTVICYRNTFTRYKHTPFPSSCISFPFVTPSNRNKRENKKNEALRTEAIAPADPRDRHFDRFLCVRSILVLFVLINAT